MQRGNLRSQRTTERPQISNSASGYHRMTSSAGALIEESLLGTRHRPHIHSELQLVPSPRSSIVLLCQPPELEKWRENRSNYAIAYGKVLAAENRATQQGKKADIVHARLAGHLLLELFRMRDNFGDTACSQLAKELLSPPRRPGMTSTMLLRLANGTRTTLYASVRSIPFLYHPDMSHFPSSPDMLRAVFHTLLTPFTLFLRHTGRHDQGLYGACWPGL